MADATTNELLLNKVLPDLAIDTNAKEYELVSSVTGRGVTFYCDVAWQYSDAAAGNYIDIPAHPAGFEVICRTGTLTPVVSK